MVPLWHPGSTGLGVKTEKMTWGSWMPHKFKIAVSGCPRNCAEATIKDFGIVCVDSGYELHVGGNGGIHVRATDFLCKVATEEEALEYCAAFIQVYREEARYLERTAPWIERVGVDYVKARVVEDEAGRRALAERFHHSQKFSQTDPWAERAAGDRADLHQHLEPLAFPRLPPPRRRCGVNTVMTNWIDIGTLNDIPQRGARTVRFEGAKEIAVFRTGDDKVFALVNECPHKKGPLSQGIVHGHSVACPLHNWNIALGSGEAQGPDSGCTPTVPVREENGRILLAHPAGIADATTLEDAA
jgi:NAD(P)H-dependent nitrite reductase small subunit